MYIVGIDIAKKSHQAAIMKPDGTLVGRSFRFTNTKQGFEFLMDKLAAVDSSLENFEFGMEATGHYWLNLYTWLADNHATVHVINPLQSDALRNLYIRKTKTDSVDAKIIAQVIRIGQYSETKLADDRMLMMRDLCRQRFFLVDMVANLKRKIIVMMDRIFPEYQGFFSDTFGKSSTAILKHCTTPEEITLFGEDNLARLSSKTLSLLVKQMMDQMELLQNQIGILEKHISSHFKSFGTKITQIPGIGPVLGASILSEIGDISRFANPKKLCAYAGIDPSVKQSGQFLGNENHMSKRGSGYLRRCLWMASFVSVNHCREITIVYKSQVSKGKTHFQSMGFVCHKLLNIIYTVLKNDIDYSPMLCINPAITARTSRRIARAALKAR